MARNRALRRRIIVAVLLVMSVAMLTLYFREPTDGIVHRVQGESLKAIAPLQSGTAQAVKPFRDAWNWTAELLGAKAENARLRDELSRLRSAVVNEQLTQAENARLKGLLAARRMTIYPRGCTFVTARVIARSTTAWNSTVTIDAGSREGVGMNDAVVSDEGLVGRITAVEASAAQVTLVTDQTSYVDAMIVRSGSSGATQGILAGSVTGDLSLEYVDKSERVEPGQIVVTSGMRNSIFVRGIPIGTVASVAQQDVELYQQIALSPFVDFHSLDFVMVVLQ